MNICHIAPACRSRLAANRGAAILFKFCCFTVLLAGLVASQVLAQSNRASPASSIAASQTIPVEDFFRRPDLQRPMLSPDGNHLGFLARSGGRLGLAVIDLEKRTSRFVATLTEADVVEFHWVNSNRLVFVSGNVSDPAGLVAPWRTGGLFAVDRDGTDARRLALPFGDGNAIVVRPRSTRFLANVSEASDEIIVASNERTFDSSDVYRLNTRTARRTLLTYDNPGDVMSWALDRDGVPRAANSLKGIRARASFRRDEKSPWVKWSEGDFRDPVPAPLAIGYDGAVIGLAYTDRSTNPRLTASLVRLDERGQVQQTLASRPEHDVLQPIFDPVGKKLVGAVVAGDRSNVLWLDDAWAALQRQIDLALPGTVNVFLPPEQSKRMLVYAYSDQNPGTVYLYDLRTKKLEFLIDSRPWIKPEQMANSRIVKFNARDDLPLTAMVTTPRGVAARNLPTIVLVHGGPWVPGYQWSWDAEAQFFASRGFVVVQPNFRGTLGHGTRHVLASFKQWGLAMQDDITDAAQWAIKQGIADPKRMCIYGASYGGYAALQGLVRTPDLFQCAVSYVGLTDLQLFHSVTWSDTSDTDFTRFLLPVMVGDPDKDRAQLRATSPAQNADKIKGAVMLAHGTEDRRVPMIHAERMKAALEREGKPVEWLIKADEGHGFVKLENRAELYSRIESFIRKHTGGN
ncbi:MAG: S9 family peptidase [Betaproteobacteria bacterium]|nr:MAG: S9 family peptidase [Betaproteobacteria bacterium]